MNAEAKKKIKGKYKDNKLFMLGLWVYRFFWRFIWLIRYILCELGAWQRKRGRIDKRYIEIKKYENIHNGKRCFIISTGPSLTLEDVEKLKNEYTFSMNNICKLFDKTDWRPTYYAYQDPGVVGALKDDKYFGNLDKQFAADYKKKLHNGKHFVLYPLNLGNHNTYNTTHNLCKGIKFSGNAYATIYDGFTITYSVIQLAVYMGFKEIYLLGCDCDYSGEKQHFIDYDEQYTVDRVNGPEKLMIAAYKVAKEYADTHGIKIYNATRGGKLEVFERVNFDDLIK